MQGREAPLWAFSARVLWGDKGTERVPGGSPGCPGQSPSAGSPSSRRRAPPWSEA